MKKIRLFFIFAGVLLLADALAVSFLSYIHSGVTVTYALGAVFVLLGVFWTEVKKYVPKAIVCVFFCGLILEALFVSFVYAYGNADTSGYDEDVLIVLGAGLIGEEVGPNLELRLELALDYYEKNPDVRIVVSGGKGEGEDITEALGMERYLISRGVPEESIIKEEASTSTEENFRFSKALLDGLSDGEYTVSFVTNDFHIFRSSYHAESAGFSDAAHIGAPTPLYQVIPNGIRETMGIVRQIILRI